MTLPEAIAVLLTELDMSQCEDFVAEQAREDDPTWFTEHPAALSADHPAVVRFREAVAVLREASRAGVR